LGFGKVGKWESGGVELELELESVRGRSGKREIEGGDEVSGYGGKTRKRMGILGRSV
jgi:hypothetical protein